ncbi:MAG: hypothetical protein JO072_02320 [Parafilimonas sp.]|nr:hypothetical protein [Parafilimonas sp.]
MATRIVNANGVYDLSNVTNLKELKEEIEFLKQGIKKDEAELEQRFRRVPQHFVKSAANNLLPSFLNKLIANGTWKILLSSLAMFANPFSKGFNFKRNIVGSAKKLGVVALLKTAYGFWSKKQAAKRHPAEIQKPAVTTLKSKVFKKG